MKGIIEYVFKYWSKHLEKAIKMMIAGILMVTIIVVAFFQFRATYNHSLHEFYNGSGMYEIMVTDTSDNLIDQLSLKCEDNRSGRICITGKAGTGAQKYTCGFLDDKFGLSHIPLEKGRMPQNESETAISHVVLDQLGWAGSIGDTITFDSGTYTVTGIIDAMYGQGRTELDIVSMNENALSKPLPLIYFGSDNSSAISYNYYMFDNIGIDSDEDINYYTELIHDELGEEGQLCAINNKNAITDVISQGNEFRYDVRWILILSGLASVIAVLSVVSVLRIIISDRKENMTILRRIGTSKKQIIIIHITECVFFTVLQTVIGVICGTLAYYALNKYQSISVGLKYYDGFTKDKYVLQNTLDPYFVAIVFSVIIMVATYFIMGLSCLRIKRIKFRRILSGSIPTYYLRIFRQRTVTMIQFISLTLIGFSVVLGYMYYTDNGKTFLNGLSYFPPARYEINNGFDMKKDNISEYYYAPQPFVAQIEAYNTESDMLPMTDGSYTLGVDDSVSDVLGDVVASGTLKQTFIISEAENNSFDSQVRFLHDDEKEFIKQNSIEKYKDFFDEGELGTKYLYRVQTKLTNKATISEIGQYVTDGSINYDNIAKGTELLVVTRRNNLPFKAGDKIKIGSIASNSFYGIEDIIQSEVQIGAVITLPDMIDRVLGYSVIGDEPYNFLTTACGAQNIGLHNAVYTELFSSGDVDGGLIPLNSGMSLISYEERKAEIKRDEMLRYGGIAFVIILMSFLGFSAYFSSISLKIRTKKYEISVIRALGSSVPRIRRYMMISNLLIPVFSCAAVMCLISGVKSVTKTKYNDFTAIFNDWASGSGSDPQMQALRERQKDKMDLLKERYFLENELWKVPTNKIVLVVFGIMVLITFLLTVTALLKFKVNISNDINKERKRT